MNFIHEQLCGHRRAHKGRPDIAVHEYLSTLHPEPLWVDRSLTLSWDFSPPYPATHTTKDILSPTTVHMLLSPSVTSSTFPKPSPPPLHPYYGVISRSKLHNSPMAVRKPPLWILIHVNNLQNKSFIPPLSSPYALDSKSGLKFHPSGETPATCRHHVDSCWCDISAWRLGGGVWT
jgi:hypothetical protein